jgi:hypothetical protein
MSTETGRIGFHLIEIEKIHQIHPFPDVYSEGNTPVIQGNLIHRLIVIERKADRYQIIYGRKFVSNLRKIGAKTCYAILVSRGDLADRENYREPEEWIKAMWAKYAPTPERP